MISKYPILRTYIRTSSSYERGDLRRMQDTAFFYLFENSVLGSNKRVEYVNITNPRYINNDFFCYFWGLRLHWTENCKTIIGYAVVYTPLVIIGGSPSLRIFLWGILVRTKIRPFWMTDFNAFSFFKLTFWMP